MSSVMDACADNNLTCILERVVALERALSAHGTVVEMDHMLVVHGAALDTAWVLLCGALVFLMQLGFAMLEAGSVREHSVIGTYMKNLTDMAIGTLAGTVFGYYLAHGVHPATITADDKGFEARKFFFYIAFQSTGQQHPSPNAPLSHPLFA
eukprot:43094-Prymnesium_polylepis.1